jgi:hypothetical protein
LLVELAVKQPHPPMPQVQPVAELDSWAGENPVCDCGGGVLQTG